MQMKKTEDGDNEEEGKDDTPPHGSLSYVWHAETEMDPLAGYLISVVFITNGIGNSTPRGKSIRMQWPVSVILRSQSRRKKQRQSSRVVFVFCIAKPLKIEDNDVVSIESSDKNKSKKGKQKIK